MEAWGETWLESLLEQEVAYAGMVAQCERTDCAWFLTAPALPDFQEANRALRLRDDGRGPEAVAREVIAYFQRRQLQPLADIDSVAEAQGIGRALRAAGMRPFPGERVLMRYVSSTPPEVAMSEVRVEIVPNETGAGEASVWMETAVSDDVGWPDEALWRAVAVYEARYAACRLYLGWLDGQPAGTCDLFTLHGWGRIDSVVTRPEFRRRGVATAMVARGVADSLTSGNQITYLFTEANGAAEQVYRRLGFERWGLNVLRRWRA